MSVHSQDPPRYEPYAAGGLICPKCGGSMRTYDRNGVHIEQCQNCRGVFLDFGELEHLTQLESRFMQQPPPPVPGYGPAWGSYGHQGYRKQGFSGLFFSS